MRDQTHSPDSGAADRASAVKLGIVGLEWVGRQHAEAIAASAGSAALTAVCDLDPAKLAPFEDRCALFSDFDRFLAEADTDAVILAVPHHLHETMAVRALRAGKSVLLEKPMARSSKECRRMIAAADESGRLLMIAHNWRYTPWCMATRSIVEAGELGPIRAVRSEWLLDYHELFSRGSWIYDGSLSGGGALTSLAIHNLDSLRFIMGEVEEVFAHELYTDEWSTNGAENWAMVQMRFVGGALGHLFTGYTPYRPSDNGTMYLYGDEGTLFYGPRGGKTGLWIASARRAGGAEDAYELVDLERYAGGASSHSQSNQLRHFIARLRDGGRPVSDCRDSARTIELLERIYESGRHGVPVKTSERAQPEGSGPSEDEAR